MKLQGRAFSSRLNGIWAFQMVELLILSAMVLVVVLIVVSTVQGWKRKASPIRCTNQLRTIGLAARIYAGDNNEILPGYLFLSNKLRPDLLNAAAYFKMLSNELYATWLLRCPEDKKRKPAPSFTDLEDQYISYFISASAQTTLPETLLAGDRNVQTNLAMVLTGFFPLTTNQPLFWSGEVHKHKGNLVLGDGSVIQTTSETLAAAVQRQNVATNYLLIP